MYIFAYYVCSLIKSKLEVSAMFFVIFVAKSDSIHIGLTSSDQKVFQHIPA